MNVIVIGGGISGQLFQHAVPEAQILDWRNAPRGSKYLTRHYGANYLWEPIEGLSCRAFRVVTHIDNRPAVPESIVAYKNKIGKEFDCDTGVLLNSQFAVESTGYEFTDLPTPRVTYGARVTGIDLDRRTYTLAGSGGPVPYDLIVSTIPLYSLLSLCHIRDPGLQYKSIWIKVAARPMDAPYPADMMYVNYISNPDLICYRYTDRNGERHFESLITQATAMPDRRVVPGKIYPHPEVPNLLIALGQHQVYCFGRFATWDVEELVHHTWEKIQLWKEAMQCRQIN